jgi:hypothetical protein
MEIRKEVVGMKMKNFQFSEDNKARIKKALREVFDKGIQPAPKYSMKIVKANA